MSNSTGSHSSPGAYAQEYDYTFTAKSIGQTDAAIAGETLKGPAFTVVDVQRWSDFETYFGGTSTEKFRGTGYPKYELPYIAKEYLTVSSSLKVCRILGLSGYDAGFAFPIFVNDGTKNYIAAIIRSKMTYQDMTPGSECSAQPEGDEPQVVVKSIEVSPYQTVKYDGNCVVTGDVVDDSESLKLSSTNLGRFTLIVTMQNDDVYKYPVSLNFGEKDYIYNVIGSSPLGSTPVYVEYLYDYAMSDLIKNLPSGSTASIVTGNYKPSETLNDYKSMFREATTPWIVSDVKSNGGVLNVKRLFRLHTISDGKSANKEVKVSIQNIKPDSGTFDLVVRSFNDSDSSPVVLEKFSGLTMVEGDKNYIGLRIGTVDNAYELNSKYIIVELEDGADVSDCVPCGFEGYNLHSSSAFTANGEGMAAGDIVNFPVSYNTSYDRNKKAKKQYFGFSSDNGVDIDLLSYKGKNTEVSNGFHLDSVLSDEYSVTGGTQNKVYIDGQETSQKFTAVSPVGNVSGSKIPRIISEAYMKGTIYEDVNLRKFTVCFQGGFDGWDEHRESRTNTDKYKGTKYSGKFYNGNNIESWMDLPIDANNSDYYAYLAAYRQFANPQSVKMNLFASPGIDAINNELLVEDVNDMITDPDDGRNGDCLYIFTTPDKPSGASDAEDERYTSQEVADLLDNSGIDSSYMCTYWPWVRVFDSNDNKYINLPATKDVLRNMASIDNKYAPWYVPAGTKDNKGVVNCNKATLSTKLADEDVLYDGMINPVKTFGKDGVFIWGNKTFYRQDTPLNRINSRRLMIRVKDLVLRASRDLVFDLYDSSLKSDFESTVKNILVDVKKNRGISDYKVSTDDSAENRDAHVLPGIIKVKPVNSLEWLPLSFNIYPESVQFDD